MSDDLFFEIPEERSAIIKVLGVGGGGSNAVNFMYEQGIKDVNFVICNTDAQALSVSPVPVKIQLGASLTEGRGAGNKPEQGREAAIESLDDVKKMLSENTKMVFITAGMGGGTGTGAAPVLAQTAREMGVLTIGIVTLPFRFEGPIRLNQAVEGIQKLAEHVDSLLVINNEKLREIFGDLTLTNAFSKADNVLTIAAKGIAEIITVGGHVNVDFADVQTVMSNSGVALMGSGQSEGEGRAMRAIQEALNSPLLNNRNIEGAKNVLLNITSGTEEITMDEMGEISEFVQASTGYTANLIWGSGKDPKLENKISVTIIATGFETDIIPEIYLKNKPKKTIHDLESGKTRTQKPNSVTWDVKKERKKSDDKQYKLFNEEIGFVVDDKKSPDAKAQKAVERMQKLKKTHEQFAQKSYKPIVQTYSIDELETIPAYKRKNIKLEEFENSLDAELSRYTLSEDYEKGTAIKKNNSYLHDKVD